MQNVQIPVMPQAVESIGLFPGALCYRVSIVGNRRQQMTGSRNDRRIDHAAI